MSNSHMTDIPLQANIRCSDGPCGKATNVIINPATHVASHIVVQDKHLPKYDTRLVPIDLIAETSPNEITLSCSKADVAAMQPFRVEHFVPDLVLNGVEGFHLEV